MNATFYDFMSDNDNISEAEIQPEPTNAITTRPAQPVSTAVDKPAVTPEQAKVDAVAQLTMSAYSRASELKLTPEEIQGLEADFEDADFRTGASGKDNLIYIEHAALRQRLNRVIGNGQWSIIPRKRWTENFTIPATRDRQAQEAVRVYVEAMLVIRGCFVAEAIGDMVYYPNNQSQNFGDAVEGAKTAALRRCAKELGIGLQAWKKEWCNGWLSRNQGAGRGPQNAPGRSGGSQSSGQRTATQPATQSASRPAATASQVLPQEATEDQRNRFIALFPGDAAKFAEKFFWEKGWLIRGEPLAKLPLKHVPVTKKAADDLVAQVEAFSTKPTPAETEAWREFVMPWGKCKDMKMGELEKNYLYGMVMNFEVEYEYNGVPKAEDKVAADELLRKMLDDAGRHYGWVKENAD